MSNTRKHKIAGKFKSGLMTLQDVPMVVLHMWNRSNFDGGKYKRDRRDRAGIDFERVGLSEIM